jgi:hypothetical protein
MVTTGNWGGRFVDSVSEIEAIKKVLKRKLNSVQFKLSESIKSAGETVIKVSKVV